MSKFFIHFNQINIFCQLVVPKKKKLDFVKYVVFFKTTVKLRVVVNEGRLSCSFRVYEICLIFI